ncbi:MAG TPA: hypothetical protein DDZ66_04820 [Firmicutes bacterium]|nr:hypothetical protein [Bacillota bacterium]
MGKTKIHKKGGSTLVCDHLKKYQHPWARIFRVRLRNHKESRLTHLVGQKKSILDAKDALRCFGMFHVLKRVFMFHVEI